jgi:hypothetical protein
LFVPTPGGVAPGPQAPGGAPATPDPDPLQALAATLQANLAQSIQAGIQQYMQAQGAPAPPPGPIRPEAHYGAPPGPAPPVPQVPPPGLGHMMGGIPPPAFPPPPAYHAQMPPPNAAPYAGAPAPAHKNPAHTHTHTNPRTGFDFNRLQMPCPPVPPGPRQSTFLAPFIPVQPSKPLHIDDFLTVNAIQALKSAPNRLLFDNSAGSISFQPDMSSVSAKKIKCPDLPAWLKASERMKSALLQIGAIQGPDYDRYQESCMTLLLDPKCGGNGWPFETFIESDNAHRLQQWTTGASFDILCPMRMAHFATMAASRASKPGHTFFDLGTGNKRPAAGNLRGPPRSRRWFTWHNTGACDQGAACPYVKGHKPCPCGDTRVHAPGACPNNPNRNDRLGAGSTGPDNAG